MPNSGNTDSEKQRFVVFDFDGTILAGHSPVMLVKSLLRRRIIPISTLLSVAWWGFRYKMHLPHEQCEVRKQIFNIFKDLSARDVDKIMEHLYDTEISRWLRRDALETIRTYQELGVPVIIVSASFEAIVKRAAVELGAFAQLSTKMEIVDDRYTGEVGSTPVEGLEKRRAFVEFADGMCGSGNWELLAAYGDHHTDIELLELARRPVAVTPDGKLRRIAHARKWEIVNWS
jgi:HAD superfamily hydrolase (TIGR01490 family)